jgi:hypothetical protein
MHVRIFRPAVVYGVVTQGRDYDDWAQYVKSYRVGYSLTGGGEWGTVVSIDGAHTVTMVIS